jgi:hypothetical protein
MPPFNHLNPNINHACFPSFPFPSPSPLPLPLPLHAHSIAPHAFPAAQVTVVVKNMFHPSEFKADPSLKDIMETDIKEEAEKLGPVVKVCLGVGWTEGESASREGG